MVSHYAITEKGSSYMDTKAEKKSMDGTMGKRLDPKMPVTPN